MSELDPALQLIDDLEIEFRRIAEHTRMLPHIYRGAGFLSCNGLMLNDYIQLGLPPVVMESGVILQQGRGISLRVCWAGGLAVEFDSYGELSQGMDVEIFGAHAPNGSRVLVPHVISEQLDVVFRVSGGLNEGAVVDLGRKCTMLTVNGQEIF